MQGRLTPLSKFLLIFGALVILYLGYRLLDSRGYLDFILPRGNVQAPLPEGVDRDTPHIRVGVVTWGGYAGGQYFNGGFKASTESRYYKDYKMLVSFVVIDDFVASRDAWKHGDIDVLWTTADAFPTETDGLKEYAPKVIFQADWSRGGDAIVVQRGINSVNDLKGKKVTFAAGTPSHTFLIQMLKAAGMSYSDVEIVPAQNAIDAATIFKAGKVDAAVVWSPDDEDCVKSVAGARVLQSTRQAAQIIADVFFAKSAYIEKHREHLKFLVEGWMIGAAELNGSDAARHEAAKILAQGLNQPEDFCYNAIANVRLTTYGDNINFFNMKGDYRGVKGEDLYRDMTEEYAKLDLASASTPKWRDVVDLSVLRSIQLTGREHAAESGVQFSASSPVTAEVSRKRVTVNFGTGSSVLTDDEQNRIQREFGRTAQLFSGNRIRIEGNTDITGDRQGNIQLSQRRAEAVAKFLKDTYGFDPKRFQVMGNGPDKPVCSENTEECYARNRRTDFILTD